MGGSPGEDDPSPPAGPVVNEMVVHTDFSSTNFPEYDSNDWIEFFNRSATNVSMRHWYLSDDEDDLELEQKPQPLQLTVSASTDLFGPSPLTTPVATSVAAEASAAGAFDFALGTESPVIRRRPPPVAETAKLATSPFLISMSS